MLSGHGQAGGKSFESEREILYSVLFDMRRDITELKNQVESLRAMNKDTVEQVPYYNTSHDVSLVQHSPSYHIQSPNGRFEPIVATDEYVEEAVSLDDVEKKTIIMALERNKGKRRNAAKELNISERTLYRKIKEYGIE